MSGLIQVEATLGSFKEQKNNKMSHVTDQHKDTRVSRIRARLLCATAFCLLAPSLVEARSITPAKPSVELHLEVLKELQAAARGTSFAAPVQGRNDISAVPLSPVGTVSTPAVVPQERLSASGRKIPEEQPGAEGYGVRSPVNSPFGQAQAPLPKPVAAPVVAAKPKPKPVPKSVEKVAPRPAIAPLAAALPEAKKPETPDISKLDFARVDTPKPQDEKKLMEALEKEKLAPAPVPEALPEIALPEAPAIPELKPDIALPEPVAETAKTPPPLPLPAPDVLVMQKKTEGDLPPIPALPAPGQAVAEDKPLLPSLEKRMDTLFAKQPDKTGILEDTTTIEDPTEESKKKAEEARRAQLKAQEDLKKQIATPQEAILPPSSEKSVLKTTEIAALPTLPALDNKAIAATSDAMDLPPPALPELTPITGDGEEKTSLDIVQPQDGVASKNIGNTAPEMLPLDAPETLPKVSKGGAEPALPPIALPSTEPEKQEKQESLPPIPDFSAVKEETPTETKVAVAPLPKPTFVKSAAKEEAAAPAAITEGSASVSLTFDKDKTDLDEGSKAKLNGLAEQIKKEARQVRIVSYAAGTAEQASIARRISLSRALQIRAHLIDRGVNQLKINVQALGNKEQAERADVFLK
jgi:outer membrane protein OmpA-like peptidoglycan-associated protein